MFIDLARVRVQGGGGGAGAMAFRRETGVPRGGPSGGNGGAGGDVVLVADPQLDTLLDFSYRNSYTAGRAGHGEGSNKTGKDGDDLELPVPPGTVVRDADSGESIGELLDAGDRLVVARGGRGGRGNASYATSTHQTPREWEPGEWGEERHIELELKLIADVGLVGEPNAGKSTFLAAVSAARPRVADYPFTTLKPNLGVVQITDGRTIVVADIPGIIEGAAGGKGLGTQFLRHIERTRTLALFVPVDAPDPQQTYDTLRGELRTHDIALASIAHCLVMTKADLVPEEERDALAASVSAPDAWATFVISSVAGYGLGPLKRALWERAEEIRALERADAAPERFPELDEWRP
jgi:GTP-binding protein